MAERLPRDPAQGGPILPWAEEVQKALRQRQTREAVRPSRANRNTYRKRYHFQVEAISKTQVIVRAGRWVRVNGTTRYSVPLTTDGGTSEDRDEYKTLTLSGSGTNYIVLTLDDSGEPTTLTASVETSAPSATDLTVRQIAHVGATSGEFAGAVVQDWTGGNIIDGWDIHEIAEDLTESGGPWEPGTGDGPWVGDSALDDRYLLRDDVDAGTVGGQPNDDGLRTLGDVKAAAYYIEGGNAGADLTDDGSEIFEKGIMTNNGSTWGVQTMLVLDPTDGSTKQMTFFGKVETL